MNRFHENKVLIFKILIMRHLTNDEMKRVMGGVTVLTEWPVNCTFAAGYQQTQPGHCSGNSKSLCEREATAWCNATPGCIRCTVGEPIGHID